MEGRCLSQNELAQRWQISESTLERWRYEGIGPVFLKLRGQVRYRDSDILAFEDQALNASKGIVLPPACAMQQIRHQG